MNTNPSSHRIERAAELVAEWRRRAAQSTAKGQATKPRTYNRCADELESALQALAATSEPPDEPQWYAIELLQAIRAELEQLEKEQKGTGRDDYYNGMVSGVMYALSKVPNYLVKPAPEASPSAGGEAAEAAAEEIARFAESCDIDGCYPTPEDILGIIKRHLGRGK